MEFYSFWNILIDFDRILFLFLTLMLVQQHQITFHFQLLETFVSWAIASSVLIYHLIPFYQMSGKKSYVVGSGVRLDVIDSQGNCVYHYGV